MLWEPKFSLHKMLDIRFQKYVWNWQSRAEGKTAIWRGSDKTDVFRDDYTQDGDDDDDDDDNGLRWPLTRSLTTLTSIL